MRSALSLHGASHASTSAPSPAKRTPPACCARRAPAPRAQGAGGSGCHEAPGQSASLTLASKRIVLLTLLAAPHARVLAAPLQDAAEAGQQPEPAQAEGILYETKDFSLRVPNDFQIVLDPAYPAEKLGRGQAPPVTPLKAKFVSPDRSEVLTVVVRESSKVKPTFLQLSDISQWGSAADTAQLIIPQGSKVFSSGVMQIELPARDTRSIMGMVKPPPQNIYRYEFATANGLHISLAVAARAGQLYMAGASTSSNRWKAAAPHLQSAVDSFRLTTPLPL